MAHLFVELPLLHYIFSFPFLLFLLVYCNYPFITLLPFGLILFIYTIFSTAEPFVRLYSLIILLSQVLLLSLANLRYSYFLYSRTPYPFHILYPLFFFYFMILKSSH